MADELEKFTTQYTIDLKDSVVRLEKLKQKMDGVNAGANKSAKEVKEFASGAADELGKLVPGVNAVSSAVRSMGAEFTVATAAITILAAGVKSVIELKNQYNAQRQSGMDLGVSPARIEEYQRKFNNASGGYVSREAGLEGVKAFASMANTAYADPTRIGREARLMKTLGVDVGERGGKPTGLNDELVQLSKGLQGKNKSEVQGMAKFMGVSQDWLMTVQKLGPAIGTITEQTTKEIDARDKASKAVDNLNDDLSKLKESFIELSNTIAQPLIPAVDNLVKLMDKTVKFVPKAAQQSVDTTSHIAGIDLRTGKSDTTLLSYLTGGLLGKSSAPKHSGAWGLLDNVGFGFGRMIANAAGAPVDKDSSKSAAEAKAAADQNKKTAADAKEALNKRVSADDERNKQGIQTSNQMTLAANMFNGAVQSFSNAVNLQQAWAAWAGEIGKANGLSSSTLPNGGKAISGGKSFSGGNGSWEGSPYADYIRKAAKATGENPNVLAAIMQVESGGNPNAVSSTGASGLMQITRGNQKAYGISKNPFDPESNIMTGAKILQYFKKVNGGDMEAALAGYNGHSDPNYVAKVHAALGGGIRGGGESKAKMQYRSVQNAIAGYLGVGLDQVQQGNVNRGDAQWASSQLMAGISNNIYALKARAATGGLPAMDYAKIQNDIRDQTRGLDLMKQYSGMAVNNERDGGRELTTGQLQIVINVNGVTDPKAVGQAVNDHIQAGTAVLLNNVSNGMKR